MGLPENQEAIKLLSLRINRIKKLESRIPADDPEYEGIKDSLSYTRSRLEELYCSLLS